MFKILVVTTPLSGHVNGGVRLVKELVRRGHQVKWYTGLQYKHNVEDTGATFCPMRPEANCVDSGPTDQLPPINGLFDSWSRLKYYVSKLFNELGEAQLEDIRTLLKEFPADVLLSDVGTVSPFLLDDESRPPWALYNSSVLFLSSPETTSLGMPLRTGNSRLGRIRNSLVNFFANKIIFKSLQTDISRYRRARGLPPLEHSLFDSFFLVPDLLLQGTPPCFEFPRRNMPAHIHLVGPFLADFPEETPAFSWWPELDGEKRVVHVTQGTVETDPVNLLIPSLKALAEEDVLVVATTGGLPVESIDLDPLPSNARLASFIPHNVLLPKVDVMITNAGCGGALFALTNGVPLVAAGRTQDKVDVSARIEWCGAGIDLKKNSPAPEDIRTAVMEILNNPRYSKRALELKQELTTFNAPSKSANLLEALARTRRANSGEVIAR